MNSKRMRAADGEVMEVDVWDNDDDDIDDALLMQASQMVEKDDVEEEERMDPAELAEMTRMLDEKEDEWREMGGMKQPERVNQTQTIFIDEVKKAGPSSVKGDSSSSVKEAPFKVPSRPVLTKDQEIAALKSQLGQAKQQVKRLGEERFQKHGEILFLRGELSKKNEMLDRERLERCREAGQKEDQVRQAEARRKADVDAAEAEKEFMRQDLRQLQESLRRTEHQMSSQSHMPVAVKKEPVGRSLSVLPSGIDCSFFEKKEENGEHPSVRILRPASPPKSNAEVQTTHQERKRGRERVPSRRLRQKLASLDVGHPEQLFSGLIARTEEGNESVVVVQQVLAFCGEGGKGDSSGRDSGTLAKVASAGSSLEITQYSSHNSNWERVWLWLRACRSLFEERQERQLAFLASTHRKDEEELAAIKILEVVQQFVKICPKATFREVASLLRVISNSPFSPGLNLWEKWVRVAHDCLERQDKKRVVASLLSLLADVANAGGFYKTICKISSRHSSCLILRLCSLVEETCEDSGLSLLTLDDDDCDEDDDSTNSDLSNVEVVVVTSIAFARFLSSLLTSLDRPLLQFGGRKKAPTSACNCGVQLLNTLVTAASRTLEMCLCQSVEERNRGATSGLTASLACRECILCLHRLRSTCGLDFAVALGENAEVQRKYIWATRRLDDASVRAAIRLCPDEDGIVNDLMVEYEDS